MTAELTQAPRTRWRKFLRQALWGGLFGAVFSLGATELVDSGMLGALGASQEAALLVGVLYCVIGLIIALGVIVPQAGATMLNVEDEGELREQRRVLGWSAGSMFLMGVLLALLALSGPASGTGQLVAPALALAATGVGWLLLTGASVYLLRNMDELMRALTRETGEVAYYLVLLVCGGWALLAWLGYVPAMGMLDFLTINHVLLLVASFIASGRRGMLAPRGA